MAQPTRPPWPTDLRVPRWARDRHGQLLRPQVYDVMQADNLDRYHIGLYRGGWADHIVEITEPGHQPARDTEARTATVKVTRVLWPRDSLAVFEQTSANYRILSLHFARHRN